MILWLWLQVACLHFLFVFGLVLVICCADLLLKFLDLI